MRRSLLFMIGIWSVLAVIIVGIIIAGLSFYNGTRISLSPNTAYSDTDGVVVDEKLDLSGIKSLKLDISAGNVSVSYSDDNSMRVVQHGRNIPEQQILEVSKTGSTANVKAKGGIQIFGFNINTINNVDIYIPEDYAGNLQIGLSAGDLEIYDDFSLDMLEIKVSAGSFSSDAYLQAKSADISLSAGGLDLSEINADDFTITASAGSIRIRSLTGSGKVSSSAGKIKIDGVDITDKLNIRSSAGSIEMALTGDPSLEYNISASAGSIETYFGNSSSGKNISGTYGSGPYKKLEASSSAGSITITQD